MKFDIDWSKSHNGVMLCDYFKTAELMPEVVPILDLLDIDWDNYLIDVKIHMLMPGMYPCIPNWHRDFQPRDSEGERLKRVDCQKKMFCWLSGPPLTVYIDKEGREVPKACNQWNSFTRNDMHKGVVSKIHTWRCFIRVIPKEFVHETTINVGTLRRQIQVYIPERYSW